jgi:hypothetical protein
MNAGFENYYAPNSDVSYKIWNRLHGVHNSIKTRGAPLQEFNEERRGNG